TVFEGELVGVSLALDMLAKERGAEGCQVAVYVDSQAALQALREPSSTSPGHYLIPPIWRQAKKISTEMTGTEIEMVWLAGHKGIRGNEEADKAAKDAATEGKRANENRKLPNHLKGELPASVSALKQNLKKRIKDSWIRQ
ncbi:hypothetical protein CONPUDRAFT_37170, partial [Coniophora puteana RWD-64-598 SS2]